MRHIISLWEFTVEKPKMVLYLVEEPLSNLSHLGFTNEILWIAVNSKEKG